MSYQIEILPSVYREIKGLPGYVRSQSYQLIDQLAQNPRPSRAAELRGKPGIYRIWLAGRWRIVYQIDDELKRVRILRVRRKEQIDYEEL